MAAPVGETYLVLVYFDTADNNWKARRNDTGALVPNSSFPDPNGGSTINAASSWLSGVGGGMMKFFGKMATQVPITLQQGTGILGEGFSHTGGFYPRIAATSTFAPGSALITLAGGNSRLERLDVDASGFADAAVSITGDDCKLRQVSARSGANNALSLAASRCEIRDFDCEQDQATPPGTCFLLASGSDNHVFHGRIGGAGSATDKAVLKVFRSNNRFMGLHITGNGNVFHNTIIRGSRQWFSGCTFDTVGKGSGVQVQSGQGHSILDSIAFSDFLDTDNQYPAFEIQGGTCRLVSSECYVPTAVKRWKFGVVISSNAGNCLVLGCDFRNCVTGAWDTSTGFKVPDRHGLNSLNGINVEP